MVIYITILLFPKSSSTTWSAGHDLFLKIQRIVYHAVGTGLFLREEREQIRPSWEAWIHVTSKRRAVLSMYLLHWAYAIWQKVPCFDCKEIGFMPAPAAKVLWQAGSEEQWNTLYTRWLARWDGRGYLQGEFDKIRPGNSMDSRAEKWLEETDEFGFIMISIGKTIVSDHKLQLTQPPQSTQPIVVRIPSGLWYISNKLVGPGVPGSQSDEWKADSFGRDIFSKVIRRMKTPSPL